MKNRRNSVDSPQREGTSLFWSLQIGGWLLFAAAVALGRIGEWSFAFVVAIDWSLAALGFVTTLGLGAVYSRIPAARIPLRRLLGIALLGSYMGSLFWTATYHVYMNRMASTIASALLGEPVQIGSGAPLLDNAVYNTLILLAWSVLYFGIQYYRALQQERERALRAEAEAHQAQLQMLAYQLNPHFLFNALNSLRAMIDEDRNRARRMVTELAGFLRYALLERPLQVARLSEELEAIQGYLQIELIRFEERLEVSMDVESTAKQCCVPAFLLHPLVENALKHGSPPVPGTPLRVRLGASVENDRLRVFVANTGSLASLPKIAIPIPEIGSERLLGGGVGLRNVRARLQHLFPGDHRIDVLEESGWVRVMIDIPVRRSAAEIAAEDSEIDRTDHRSALWESVTL